MPLQPLVSIVTPSYNQGGFIKDTILSIQNQDYPRIEHIVVDGGSTDNTLEILKKYDTKITWISEKDRGQADAVNKGFAMAKGEIVGWLNSDDVYFDKDVVYNVVKTLEKFEDVDLIYGDFVRIDEKNLITKLYHCPRKVSYKHFFARTPISQPAVFFRRRVIEDDVLDISLNYVMDLEFWLRLVVSRRKFKYLNRILAAERMHGDCKSVSQLEKLKLEARYVRRKYFQFYGVGYHISYILDKIRFGLLRAKSLSTLLSLYSKKGDDYMPKLRFDSKLNVILRQLNLL